MAQYLFEDVRLKTMSFLRGRTGPLALTLICAALMWVEYFFGWGKDASAWLQKTTLYLASFGAGIGVAALTISHAKRIREREKNQWPYSALMLALFYITMVTGLLPPMGANSAFQWLYNTLNLPVEVTIGSIIAYFYAIAAYRTFRVKNIATFLVIAVTAVTMLKNVPIGEAIWGGIPVVGQWVLDVPVTGAFRGVIIGAAMGLLSTTIRTILGREPGYP